MRTVARARARAARLQRTAARSAVRERGGGGGGGGWVGMFGHEARGELLAERDGRHIHACREASAIGRRDKRGARAVPGAVATAMICIASDFIPVMLRRPLIAAVVRMCRCRLVVSSVKTDS